MPPMFIAHKPHKIRQVENTRCLLRIRARIKLWLVAKHRGHTFIPYHKIP